MNDFELVSGLRCNDSLAQKVFWDIYCPKLYGICNRILHNGPDAMDLTVDLLTDFMAKRVHDIDDPKAMGGYLRLMAIRRSLDQKEKRGKSTTLDFDVSDNCARTPEDEAVYSTLMPKLSHCLDNLTDKAKQTLRLKYTEQWSNERIGEIVGGSRQYIGRLIRQSLSVLKTCINQTS